MTLLTPEQQHVQDELRTLIGRTDFALASDGRGVLAAAGVDVVVDVPAHGRHMVCSTALGTLPADPTARHATLMAALQYNMFLAAGDGAAVAAHPNGDGSLYLCYRAPLSGLDSTVLGNIIGNLAARTGPLTEQLLGPQAAAAPAGSSNASNASNLSNAPTPVPPPALPSQFMTWRA